MAVEKTSSRKKNIKSIVTIGAGFSGLAVSLLLARAGLQVTLVERNNRVAPLLQNYSHDGFAFNNGFHYIGGYYPGGALHNCFKQFGIEDKLKPLPINDDGFDHFSGIADEDIVVPVGIERVRLILKAAFPASTEALTEYFNLVEKVFKEFSFSRVEEFFYQFTPSLTEVSLLDFLVVRKAEDRLIDFLDSYSQLLLGMEAGEVPLLTHLLGIGAYFYSAQTFSGGGGALVTALEEQVRQAGVRILTGCEAVIINCKERRFFSGVRIRSLQDGKETDLTPDACIGTIHPKRLLQILPEGSAFNLFSRRIAGYNDTRSICLFHLAVEKKAADTYLGNYHKFKREASGGLVHQITLLPDAANPLPVHGGEKQMTVMMTAWNNEADKGCPQRWEGKCRNPGLPPLQAVPDKPIKLDYIEKLQDHMVYLLDSCFPGLKGKYRIINTMGPCHFDRLNATWDGSIYGVKCKLNRFGLSSIGPVKGLFLAGQSITAPGIFGTLVSAYLVYNRIMGNIEK